MEVLDWSGQEMWLHCSGSRWRRWASTPSWGSCSSCWGRLGERGSHIRASKPIARETGKRSLDEGVGTSLENNLKKRWDQNYWELKKLPQKIVLEEEGNNVTTLVVDISETYRSQIDFNHTRSDPFYLTLKAWTFLWIRANLVMNLNIDTVAC